MNGAAMQQPCELHMFSPVMKPALKKNTTCNGKYLPLMLENHYSFLSFSRILF
jgi:hypothetical protein